MREDPRALVRLAVPDRAIRSVRPDETEHQAIERRMDKLLRVRFAGQREAVWFQVDVEASWKADVPRRVFGRWALAHRSRKSLRTLVLVLKRGKRQGRPRSTYEVSVLGRPVLAFRFDVVCAWNLDAEDVLGTRNPGMLSLVPFTRGAEPSRVDEAFELLASQPGQEELQLALALIASRVFPGHDWFARIPEEVRMRFPAFEAELKNVAAEAADEAIRGLIARLLRRRLGRGKRVNALIAWLPFFSPRDLDKIVDLVASTKTKTELLAQAERLLPARRAD